MVDAMRTVQEGLASIAAIDSAMQLGANHPMGPLALADFIGLDIVFHMSNNLYDEYREPRFTPPPLLRRLVLAGYLGRKSGKGFYDYSTTPADAERLARRERQREAVADARFVAGSGATFVATEVRNVTPDAA